MSVGMFTALDRDGALVDLLTLDAEQRVEYHGRRNRRRHGHVLVCKGCYGAVHVVHNSIHSTWYFRHDPGVGRTCLLEELSRRHGGQSDEHLGGIVRVAGALRKLRGWDVAVESVHTESDDPFRFDIEATYSGTPAHERQRSAAFEVQLSDQPDSVFVDRTRHMSAVSGLPVYWLTPHVRRVGDLDAMICDPAAELIADRLLTSYEPRVTAEPAPVERIVRSVFRPRPGHRWFHLGEHSETYVVDINAWTPPTSSTGTRRLPWPEMTPDERKCDRPSIISPRAHDEPALLQRVPTSSGGRRERWVLHCRACDELIPFAYGGRDHGPQCEACWIGGGRERARAAGRIDAS